MTIDLNELISGLFDELFSPCCYVLIFYKTMIKSTMHLHEPFTYIVSRHLIIKREGKSHFFNWNASFQICQIYFKLFVHGFLKLHFFQNLKLSVRLTYLIWLVGRHLGWSIARSFNHKLVIWWGSFRMMWYQPEWTSSYC